MRLFADRRAASVRVRVPQIRPLRRQKAACWLSALLLVGLASPSEGAAGEPSAPRYAPEVIEKAERYLEAAGLRVSGKSLQVAEAARVFRVLGNLTGEARDLALLRRDQQTLRARQNNLAQQLQNLNRRYRELNLQLAQAAGVDVATNNRIVATLNAITAQLRELDAERQGLAKQIENKNNQLRAAETKYAETVLAIREQVDLISEKLDQDLQRREVRIALDVAHVEFGTPQDVSATDLLAALRQRLKKVEADVFRDTIPLKQSGEQGPLLVDAVIDGQAVAMVVDSGASLVMLPAQVAQKLGIVVPADARDARLVLADGKTIPGKQVQLPEMRVGEFVAKEVAAVILQDEQYSAPPLLGMSYLKRFKFEIDAAEKTLTLLRIGDPGDAAE